ncbi:MAG TPA: glycosyltransferase family 1 protein, partial [Kofleriaceae bacterium]|nr:glycosyltransferase family 1 protein [Kofleriaceae bacterium]
MRIGINALFLIPGKVGGSETYVRSLVRALQAVDDRNDYVLYTNVENAGSFDLTSPRWREVRAPIKATSRVARMGWEQAVLPLQTIRDRIDVLHSPGYTAPLALRCANLASILDLNYHFHPEDWTPAALRVNRALIPLVAKAATRILTISESSRGAIIDVLGIAPDKVSVSLLGADGNLVDAGPDPAGVVKEKFGLDGPYLFTVTASHPHKNVDGLFRAYELACRDWPSPPPLVVVGIRGRQQERLEAMVRDWKGGGRIVFPGWVDAPTLAALYRQARVFVFASKYEGFGIPPLEAMSVDVPVVSSNRTSLAEVCGDGAITLDPDDLALFAKEIRRVFDDETLRADLIARGRAQVAKFTWRRTAEVTIAEYERTVREKRAS